MIKKLLLSAVAATLTIGASAQIITITSADMPRLGDSLFYGICTPESSLNPANTGPAYTWDFSLATPVSQGVDAYRTVTAAGFNQSGIPAGAYGFQIADTLEFPGAPASLTNVNAFFSNSSTRFAAVGLAANVNAGLPIPLTIAAPYSDEDEWYNFPLTFGRYDSTTFRLTASLSGFGSVLMKGYRKTSVDGWGTIVTPAITTPMQVIRVRSEIVEIDSVTAAGSTFGFPRHTVEYQWLGNGLRYPALWITTMITPGDMEVPTAVRYRQQSKLTNVGVAPIAKPELAQLSVYPNPATGGNVRVTIPAGWRHYEIAVYDATGRMLSLNANSDGVATEALPAGKYTVIVRSGDSYGMAQFVK